MTEHPYGWMSLLPPVAAIVLAIATRRIIVSLLAGVLMGALIMCQGDPLAAVADTLEVHLWKTLTDEFKLRVFCFTILMGAMVGVIDRAGGMRGLVQLVSPWAKTRRRGQLATWFLGLLIFFDDYANTILLGNTLRPLCDRLKISREKLAYLVDSTAAPVAGLALISTWVAIEVDLVRDGLATLPAGTGLSAFDLFISSIPYRFYVLLSLVFVPLIALLGRDFGPMLSAERRQIASDNMPVDSELEAADTLSMQSPIELDQAKPARALNAIVPICVTLFVVVWLIYTTGRHNLADAGGAAVRPPLRDIFGQADSSLALFYGSLAGLVVITAMAWLQRILNSRQIFMAATEGARFVLPAIAILWLASTMSRMTGNESLDGQQDLTRSEYRHKEHRLYTGDYLAGILTGTAASSSIDESTTVAAQSRSISLLPWLPTIVFTLAAIVAFSTGTSWGTMGILLPMVIPLAYNLLTATGEAVSAENPILLSSVGGVLAGAIFGDHCSPISDTTVLSSQSSGCDHMAHVWTQMPYALLVAVVSILFGTLPLGFGVSVWVLLPLSVLVLIVLLLVLGKPVYDRAHKGEPRA